MAHLRMAAGAITERAGWKPRHLREGGYLFTQSRWHCLRYIAGQPENTLIEGTYIDPHSVFPPQVMRQVDYAVKYGIAAHVVELVNSANERTGAMLVLHVEPDEIQQGREIGFYGVRYQLSPELAQVRRDPQGQSNVCESIGNHEQGASVT